MRFTIMVSALATVANFGCSTHPTPSVLSERDLISAVDVSCIGSASAETFMIYLHGMDSALASQQEIENRNTLNKIATAKNIRVALPRAQMKCPNQPGLLCWGWQFDEAELVSLLPRILQSRTACFAKDQPYIILGFSNGGYLISRWYSNAIMPSYRELPKALIAVGSGKGAVPINVHDLSKNPKLTLVIGTQDRFNFDPSEALFHQLQDLEAPVKLIEFEGGHALDEASLLKAL